MSDNELEELKAKALTLAREYYKDDPSYLKEIEDFLAQEELFASEAWDGQKVVPFLGHWEEVLVIDEKERQIYFDHYDIIEDYDLCSGIGTFSWVNTETVLSSVVDNLYNALVIVNKGKVYGFHFGDGIYVADDEYDCSEEDAEAIKAGLDIAEGYGWHATDAWRGRYASSDTAKEEWVKAVEGWVAIGGNDETIQKLVKIERGKVKLDYPVIFVFPASSNVAVQYFDVYVRKGDVEKFKTYLGAPYGKDTINLDVGYDYTIY